MKLKSIGFFQELDHGDPSGPRLVELVRGNPQPEEPKIVNYLRNGILLMGCPGLVSDVLDEDAGIIGPPHIMTDGVWAWPGDLPYYIEKYHLALPDEFLDYLRSKDLNPPAAGDFDLSCLEL